MTSLNDGTLDIIANMDDNVGPEIRGPAPLEDDTTLKDVIAPTVAVGVTTYVNGTNANTYNFSETCDTTGG